MSLYRPGLPVPQNNAQVEERGTERAAKLTLSGDELKGTLAGQKNIQKQLRVGEDHYRSELETNHSELDMLKRTATDVPVMPAVSTA